MGENRLDKGTLPAQRILVAVSVAIFSVKTVAWAMTGSVAVLTDALESTVNVLAGLFGLYSIVLSSKPKDREHPYGHGKIEFISSAAEGILVMVAGLIIIYEALNNLVHPHVLHQLDTGMLLLVLTAAVNYLTGTYCIRKGKKENSPVLLSGGTHLRADTWSTLGIIAGIGLIMLTGLEWIDSAAAIFFAGIIIRSGYLIIRRAVSGIMDESDISIISEIVEVLKDNRKDEWVDVHNMRVINYAGFYHIDCHLTIPYYINIHEGHRILDSMTDILKQHFRDRVEFFVHLDGCMPAQCRICRMKECPKRSEKQNTAVEWTVENFESNVKHGMG